MFKALLQQSWHNLSDPGLEKQLARDLLFRRFVGLSLADSVPDYSTIWRFLQLLEKQDLMGALLSKVNRQLSLQGPYIRSGEISMVDASVIQAQRSRPNKDSGLIRCQNG
jgi:IS5 family transposase